MPQDTMKIRLLEPYGLSAIGDVLDPDPPVAQLLIERGAAEPLPSETKAVKTPPRNKLVHASHTKNAAPDTAGQSHVGCHPRLAATRRVLPQMSAPWTAENDDLSAARAPLRHEYMPPSRG
jgi:hypothetical protein